MKSSVIHCVRVAALIADFTFSMAVEGQTIDHSPNTPASALRHIAHGEASASQAGAFVSSQVGAHEYEITFSGRGFESRDQVEGYLLYRAALLARDSGHGWFMLLHLPGEHGIDDHPARPNPAFGEAYRHWQPHWNYYLIGEGWQPWHPEWNAPFWTQTVAIDRVEQFQVHAIIQLGVGSVPADQPMAFDALRIIRDLADGFGSEPTSQH